MQANITRRRTLALVAAATAIGALGLAAGGSAGALLTEEITGAQPGPDCRSASSWQARRRARC